MLNFRENLDKVRMDAVKKLCDSKIEELFQRLINVIRFDDANKPIDLISEIEIKATICQQNFSKDRLVCMIARTQNGRWTREVRTTFSQEVEFEDIKTVYKYLLDREHIKYDVVSSKANDNICITFKI